MTLNKAKGRMFKSVGWTWNPIAGCDHDCAYCWARSLSERYNRSFEPQFREKYLNDKMPNDGSWIFVGSMGDTFCSGVQDTHIYQLLSFIKQDKSNNKFLLMTKNPARLMMWRAYLKEIKEKIIIGTTIETNRDTSSWSNAISTEMRKEALNFAKIQGFNTFVSMEPLADFDLGVISAWLLCIDPEAIEIGLENYSNYTTKPNEEKIKQLLDWLDEYDFTYVLKDNLVHLNGGN